MYTPIKHKLVTSPLQQERIQTVQNLPALSPARQQAVQDSWQRAAQPLYQALRSQLEALQQIQDPAQRRMTEAALERPFYLLWQEAARRQAAPVAEGLMQQDGGNPSRLLAEAAAARFYDLLWEVMKGRSREGGGVPGIALLESEAMPRGAVGNAVARRGMEPGRLAEKGAGGDGMAKFIQRYPKADETIEKQELFGYDENGKMYRKLTNTGAFAHLSERMSKKHIRQVAKEFSIDLTGLSLTIDANEEMLGKGYFGLADYERIGSIFFFPDAFANLEELVRTLVHEKTHVEQYKKYGVAYVEEYRKRFEDEAYAAEDEFIECMKKEGRL